MQQRSIAQTHLVKFTLPSLVNNVLGKGCPHEIALLFRKPPPTGLDGLPRAIECGHQDANGTRIKNVVIGKEVTHLRFPSQAYIAPIFFNWRDELPIATSGFRPQRELFLLGHGQGI
jgi:hypothetical protein